MKTALKHDTQAQRYRHIPLFPGVSIISAPLIISPFISQKSIYNIINMMTSPDGCSDLVDTTIPAVHADDLAGDSDHTITQSRCQEEFPIILLPKEICTQILSLFLPDVEEIYPGDILGYSQGAGSGNSRYIWTTYRHDGARCEMAVMRANRQLCGEMTSYLYDRLTLIVVIGCDGVNVLTNHWGCGRISDCSLSDVPFHRFKCVWLQVEASHDQSKDLVHIRRNLLDFCGILSRSESPKRMRVDFWDSRHHQAGKVLGFEESTGVQDGVKMTTIDLSDVIDYKDCTEEFTESGIWRAANSTGTALVETDIEAILQPLKILRDVKRCQIFLNPHLREDKSLVELVALHEKIVQSKEEITLEDLKAVHELSEDLYQLAEMTHEEKFAYILSTDEERMGKLLWQSRKGHKLPFAPVDEDWLIMGW